MVLSALDLYRRRNDALGAETPAAPGTAPLPPVQQRLLALEESDLEQARLLSDLSQQVESLARVVAAQAEEARRREAALRRWTLAAVGLAAVAGVLACWVALR